MVILVCSDELMWFVVCVFLSVFVMLLCMLCSSVYLLISVVELVIFGYV